MSTAPIIRPQACTGMEKHGHATTVSEPQPQQPPQTNKHTNIQTNIQTYKHTYIHTYSTQLQLQLQLQHQQQGGGNGSFLTFRLLLGTLCILGVLALLVILLVCTRFGFQRYASYWTRPEGGGWWGALSLLPLGVCWAAQKTASHVCNGFCDFHGFKLKMLPFVGRPTLHSYDACTVYRVHRASRRDCRQKHGKTSFSPKKVFLFSRNSPKRFWGLILWYLWIGRVKNPGPGSPHPLAVVVLNVGGWLTHGDLALAVTEHRLILARVRREWARLRCKGVASIWAPASQDSSHVGNAGVGIVSHSHAVLCTMHVGIQGNM